MFNRHTDKLGVVRSSGGSWVVLPVCSGSSAVDVFWTEVFGSAVPAVRCCACVSCVCVIELGGRLDIVDSGVLDEVL